MLQESSRTAMGRRQHTPNLSNEYIIQILMHAPETNKRPLSEGRLLTEYMIFVVRARYHPKTTMSMNLADEVRRQRKEYVEQADERDVGAG